MTKKDQRGRTGMRGMEIFEIQPVILGGDATDPKNKIWLSRSKHIEAVRFWNKVIRDMKSRER